MDEKIKGLLAYLFGWLGGVVILFGFKDNSQQTKFNACQSIVLSVAGLIISLVLGFIPVVKYFAFLLNALVFVLQIIGMVKAYQEQDYEIPVISDLTRDLFKNKLA